MYITTNTLYYGFYFRDEGYCTRIALAALDHNMHLGRKQAMTQDGTPRNHHTYRSRSSRWDVIPVLEPKQYGFIKQLVANVFAFQSQSQDALRTSCKRPSIPESIAPTIAKQPLLQTSEIIEKKKSRFSTVAI